MGSLHPFMELLWPTLAATVAVFIVSSLIHTVSPWHKNDYPALPNEDAFRKAVGPLNIPPGDYFVPRPDTRAQMQDPAFLAKVNEGPRVIMTVQPNGMGSLVKPLVWWFVYCLVVNIIASHVAFGALHEQSPSYRLIFHTVGLTAFAGYALALWQARIWFEKSLSVTVKSTIDGLIYAIVTAGIFGWMWPK
jgi:hypothetical protein